MHHAKAPHLPEPQRNRFHLTQCDTVPLWAFDGSTTHLSEITKALLSTSEEKWKGARCDSYAEPIRVPPWFLFLWCYVLLAIAETALTPSFFQLTTSAEYPDYYNVISLSPESWFLFWMQSNSHLISMKHSANTCMRSRLCVFMVLAGKTCIYFKVRINCLSLSWHCDQALVRNDARWRAAMPRYTGIEKWVSVPEDSSNHIKYPASQD